MKRPFHALSFFGTFGHHAFELGKGVGLVFQPELGLAGASILWGVLIPGSIVTSTRASSRWEPILAWAMGANLCAAALHFTLWPWELRRGVPVLVEAEGLESDDLPYYNAILYVWGVTAAVAMAREVRRGHRRWALAGMVVTAPLRRHARFHFEWIARQAETNPAWWNRALQTKTRTRKNEFTERSLAEQPMR